MLFLPESVVYSLPDMTLSSTLLRTVRLGAATLLLALTAHLAHATDNFGLLEAAKKKRKSLSTSEDKFKGKGISVKLVPAFFYNTVGLELEFPLSKSLTAGINFYGKLGRTDNETSNYRVRQNAALENGYLAEAAIKYYFDEAPSGWYLQGSLGVGNLTYEDGSARPFSWLVTKPEFKNLNTPYEVPENNPFRVGLGGGYQWVIIPRHLVANFMGGVYYFTSPDASYLSPYLAPSVGFIF